MFEKLRRSLGATPRRLDVFFRDDDADADLPELRRLLALFGGLNLPLSLAVIPGTLDSAGAELLRSAHRSQPIELHQHGWIHVNHEPEGRKCEFGAARTLLQQRADIGNGRDRLTAMLNGAVVPIFTPPWNRCTSDTRQALHELGFVALSKDRDRIPQPRPAGLAEISICLDIFQWKNGGSQLKSAERIETEAIEALRHSEPLGVLLHHKVMPPAAFDLVASLIDALRSDSRVRFHTVEGLWAN